MNRNLDVETLIAWNAARESVFLREREHALADYHRETVAALRAQQASIDALEAGLNSIEDLSNETVITNICRTLTGEKP